MSSWEAEGAREVADPSWGCWAAKVGIWGSLACGQASPEGRG